jgi:hypothetical protein
MAVDEESSVPHQEPEMSGKKKIILGIVAIAVVIMVVAAIMLSAPKFTITQTNETIVITVHNLNGSVEYRFVNMTIKNANGDHPLQNNMVFTVEYSNDQAGNTLNITAITTSQPGFMFVSCSPALPLTLPMSPAKQGVQMTFSTPATFYSGPFSFVVYMDLYPMLT